MPCIISYINAARILNGERTLEVRSNRVELALVKNKFV